jgi:hypothetical protein
VIDSMSSPFRTSRTSTGGLLAAVSVLALITPLQSVTSDVLPRIRRVAGRDPNGRQSHATRADE